MNDLFISVAKERIVPTQPGIIDYPNEHTESQLYRLAVYITQNIIQSFYFVKRWNKDEQTALTLALCNNFPKSWLNIAETSPTYHLQLQKVIKPYKVELSDESVERIHKIIEFLCYEVIETTVIRSSFLPLQQITPIYLKQGIDSDPVLKNIIQRHSVILTDHIKLKSNFLRIQSPIDLSIKSLRLIRIYIEELINHILIFRLDSSQFTMSDIEYYIKVYSFP